MKLYRYSKVTGEILARCIRNVSALQIPPDEGDTGYIVVESFGDDYIDIDQIPHAVMPKTPLSATWNKTRIEADGVDEAVLSSVPAGCEFLVGNTTVVVEDGTLEVTAELVGEYPVKVLTPRFSGSWYIEAY